MSGRTGKKGQQEKMIMIMMMMMMMIVIITTMSGTLPDIKIHSLLSSRSVNSREMINSGHIRKRISSCTQP